MVTLVGSFRIKAITREFDKWVFINENGQSNIKKIYTKYGQPKGWIREIALFCEEPFSICDGTSPTCAYILYTGYGSKQIIEKWIDTIREFTQDIDIINDSTINAFYPILELFPPGVYDMEIRDHILTVEHYIEDKSGKITEVRNSVFWDLFGSRIKTDGLRPFVQDFQLIPTQHKDFLNPAVVKKYKKEISQGKRPFGICWDYLGSISFLLDGHHKAMAYHELGIPFPCLTISKYELKSRYYNSEFFEGYVLDENKYLHANEVPENVIEHDRTQLKMNPWFIENFISIDEHTSLDYSNKLRIKELDEG